MDVRVLIAEGRWRRVGEKRGAGKVRSEVGRSDEKKRGAGQKEQMAVISVEDEGIASEDSCDERTLRVAGAATD